MVWKVHRDLNPLTFDDNDQVGFRRYCGSA